MNRFALAAPLLAVLALTAGCGKKPEQAPAIDGTYLLVGLEGDGIRMTEEDIARYIPEADRKMVIQGNQLTATRDGKAVPTTVRLDPSERPAAIDLTEPGPGEKANTATGIYQLDGDTLTLCLIHSGDPKTRPTDFRPDGRATVLRYRKQ